MQRLLSGDPFPPTGQLWCELRNAHSLRPRLSDDEDSFPDEQQQQQQQEASVGLQQRNASHRCNSSASSSTDGASGLSLDEEDVSDAWDFVDVTAGEGGPP